MSYITSRIYFGVRTSTSLSIKFASRVGCAATAEISQFFLVKTYKRDQWNLPLRRLGAEDGTGVTRYGE